MAVLGPKELEGIYDFAVQLAKDAGELLMAGAKGRYEGGRDATLRIDEKESAVDIVTKVDKGASSRIRLLLEADCG